MLHNAEILVAFDPDNIRNIDDAKKKYIEARNEGRSIIDVKGVELKTFPLDVGEFWIKSTRIKEGHVAMRIFDDTGDQRLIWNFNDPAQIKEAADKFDKFVKKGWKPYAIGHDGKRSQRIFLK